MLKLNKWEILSLTPYVVRFYFEDGRRRDKYYLAPPSFKEFEEDLETIQPLSPQEDLSDMKVNLLNNCGVLTLSDNGSVVCILKY